MDNQMLISMMGSTSSTRKSESSNKAASANADAFSQALEEATGTNGAESERTEELISEKSTPKTQEERRKAENAEMKAQAQAQAKANMNPVAGSKNYLYQLMYKNPDAMSLAEKQSLNLGEKGGNKLDSANTQGLNFRELQTMMTQRGVNLKELSFTQMANLTKSGSRTNVNQFLEALAKEQTGETSSDTSAKKQSSTDSGLAATTSIKGEGKTPDASIAQAAVNQADQTSANQQLTPTQKRQQVIEQIVDHMELRNFANKDELHLKLNPEYLGELKIQLTRKDNGEVSAKFITTSDDTKQVLSETRSDLRQRVESKGMHLGNIDVELVEELA